MIPADVDIDDLTRQLNEDSVAFAPLTPAERVADLEPGLLDAVSHAADSGFGSLGVAVLDHSPPHGPDVRDVAQELLLGTGLETVIVRTPHLGAVVSDVHSRAEIESAERPLLGDPDVVGGVHAFIDTVNGTSIPWGAVAVAALVVVALAVAATSALVARRSGERSSLHP